MRDAPYYHTLQRSKECGLAAVCLALNLDYTATSNEFYYKYGMSWVACKDVSPHKNYEFLRSLGVKGNWFDQSRPTTQTPDLSGFGVLTIMFNRGTARHAVAFKNGIIHDSDKLYPMPFLEWKRRTRFHIIDGHERLD